METIRYWDGKKHIEFVGELLHTEAGWTGQNSYRVEYITEDGRRIFGTRHRDRGDLMTDVRIIE